MAAFKRWVRNFEDRLADMRDCGIAGQIWVARPLLATRFTQRGGVSQMISARGNELRKPETAGNVWTISPREARRTAGNASDMRGLEDGTRSDARGVVFGVADDGYAVRAAGRDGSLGDGVGGVVVPLAVPSGRRSSRSFSTFEFGEN